ncbi:hypothetical protein JY651_50980 [Pyxidicoccus parkwayensis]|uniref:Uncharacterized protein n=1 Tax=Pyxidicoccus parkwayensis TaxID=2813578 RepID=A0ABX7P0U5_9BACT|nr:hypothetical protein [Pyxidicoccus parkwaysis]QSQ23311.1 hypothetical protein JY651_50980 [Pyxidicoccus parkwaysis]
MPIPANVPSKTPSSPGADPAAQSVPPGLPVRARSGSVLLPDPEFRLSFSWQCSADGQEVSGSVMSVTTRETRPFKLSATHPREQLELPMLGATVDVWLQFPLPQEIQLHAEAQPIKPLGKKRDPSWIAVWMVGAEPPCPPIDPIVPDESLEAFSYLLTRPIVPPCCARRRERFIFRNDPALPPPPPSTPTETKAPAAPTAAGTDAPAASTAAEPKASATPTASGAEAPASPAAAEPKASAAPAPTEPRASAAPAASGVEAQASPTPAESEAPATSTASGAEAQASPTPPGPKAPAESVPSGSETPEAPIASHVSEQQVAPLLRLYHSFWCLEGTHELDVLTREAEQVLGMPLLAYLSLPATRQLSDDAWAQTQELSASTNPSTRADTLILVLRMLAFLIRLQTGDAALRAEAGRRQALEAIVVLPLLEQRVPEKKAAGDATTDPVVPSGQGWTRLFGLGRLRSIRQALKGYEPGEIAFTLNVMPREKRILSERLRLRAEQGSVDGHRHASSTQQVKDRTTGTDVSKELEDLVGSLKLTRDFTQLKETVEPNGLGLTVNGSWTGSNDSTLKRTQDGNHEAQRAVDMATNQLQKRVVHERELRLHEEYEKASRAIHDNLDSDRRQVGIYRWLKKLYTMSVQERGSRLVIEFLVPSPAEALPFVLGAGEDVPEQPVSLNRLTPPISSYKDVNATNYQVLVACYRARRVVPPPEQSADNSAYEAWQVRTYDALVAGYRRLYEVWRAQYWQWVRESPLSLRELERAALKRQCLEVLRALDPNPPEEKPAALRYFDAAFEWAEMSYRFYSWDVGSKPAAQSFHWVGASKLEPCPDPLFLSFLQASSARVLVPVVPEYWRTLAFLFQLGHMPAWSPGEVPLPETLVPLARVLLDVCGCEHKEAPETWTVAVPTSLLYLSEGSQLPGCK